MVKYIKDTLKRQNMALVFISHSSVDKEKTDEVFESLKKAGFDATFLDHDEEKGIKVGEEWEKRLYSEIKKAYAFVVLLSPSWIESKWCFVEYTQAKALGKEIIPVIIDHGEDNEVYEWIDSHIQKCDLTQDKKAAISSNGEKIISGSGQVLSWDDNTIKIWDSKSGELLQTLKGHDNNVHSVSFSPDGTKVVSCSYDKTIKIWDSKNGELLQTLKGHNRIIKSVSLSLDGSKIVSGSEDDTIKIWDTQSGKLLQTLKGHKYDVKCVSFSPDGSKIVSCSYDKTIKIWDIKNGKLLQTLKGHSSEINSVSFSPDGTKIVSGSKDKTICIWDITKLNDKAFINKKIKELQNSLGMKLDGVRFVPLDKKEKQP